MIIVHTILNTKVEVMVTYWINGGSREAIIGPFICCVVRTLVSWQVGLTHWALLTWVTWQFCGACFLAHDQGKGG